MRKRKVNGQFKKKYPNLIVEMFTERPWWSIKCILAVAAVSFLIYFATSHFPQQVKAEVTQTGTPPLEVANYEPVAPPEMVKDFNMVSYEDKKEMILERLNKHDLTNKEINTLMQIAHLESCRNTEALGCWATDKTPPVEVRHCQKSNGSYYVVEVSSTGGQASCRAGDVQTGSEQSIGIFQILVTTWKGYNCEGQIRDYNYKEQVDCAVKIYKQSGFNAWSTYNLIDKK